MKNSMQKQQFNVESFNAVDKIDDGSDIVIGQWYLLSAKNETLYLRENNYADDANIKDEHGNLLVCADSFESNLVVFRGNLNKYRVLNKHLHLVVLDISEAEGLGLIQKQTAKKQRAINQVRDEIQHIIAQVSMSGAAKAEGREVAITSKDAIMEQRKTLSDIHAKNIEKLNRDIKNHVEELSNITEYYALPATTGISKLETSKDIIDEKLYELGLYGGLKEEVVKISEGGVANESGPIYIFQNLKYMDVECITGYADGGISVSSVADFNKWLAVRENRDRILPKDKCIVAIRVRKYPSFAVGSWLKTENRTYLYFRNGENITSIRTNIKIDKTLLATESDISGGAYALKVSSHKSIEDNYRIISKREYDHLLEISEAKKGLFLNILLAAYQLKVKFLKGMLSYATLRYKLLSKEGDTAYYNDRLLDKHGIREYSYDVESEEVFEERCQLNKDYLARAEEAVEKIKDCIKNNNSDPKLGMPNASNTSTGFVIAHGETGFADHTNKHHFIEYNRKHFAEDVVELRKELASSGLYAIYDEKLRSDTNSPFEIQSILNRYRPIDEDNYFFDDLKRINWQKHKRQNDLAVLIQGVFDRTSIFGHTSVNLFKDGYDKKIKLVYDKDKGLYDGDMPDFKGYIKACNTDSAKGDMFYGQHLIWSEIQEGKREERGWSYDKIPMPMFLPAEKLIKKRDGRLVVKFRWKTPREAFSEAKTRMQTHIFECDIDNLINVSHYRAGDCEQFAKDPRCRDRYPQWGKWIMSAEMYKQSKK